MQEINLNKLRVVFDKCIFLVGKYRDKSEKVGNIEDKDVSFFENLKNQLESLKNSI